MKRTLPLFLPVLALAAGLSSCEHRKYEIVMSTRGDVLERKLIATRVEDGNFPEEEIAAIAKLYSAHEANEPGRRYTFTGAFRGQMPNDVGGAGFHIYLSNPLGGATAYIERFRGSDDLLEQVETRLKATDRLIGLLGGWLKTQVGGEKDFDKLQAFLDKEARRDMKDLSLYLWMMTNNLLRTETRGDSVHASTVPAEANAAGIATAAAASEPRTPTQSSGGPSGPSGPEASLEPPPGSPENAFRDVAARICQFLLEKGYLQGPDASLLYKVARAENDQERNEAASALVEKVLASKAGIENRALVRKIGACFTTEANAARDSLRAYLRQTPEYQTRLAAWKADANKDPNSPEPDAMAVLEEPGGECFGLALGGSENDDLLIRLACPDAPIYTNGTWDKEAKAVFWSREIRKAGNTSGRMSTLCYAVWAQPDEAFQKTHFGGVVLSGGALLEYCVWRNGLSAKEAAEWDALVASLAPNPGLMEKVRAFAFAPAPAPQPAPAPATQTQPAEPPRNYLQLGKDMILRAVEGSPATRPAGQK